MFPSTEINWAVFLCDQQKICPDGQPTSSAHPARFSPDDKFSRHRVTVKKRFGLLLTQQPRPILWERERQRKRRELDGWRSDQETQRDEDGTVKNYSLFRIMKVQPGPLLWLKFRGLFMVWISAADLFFFLCTVISWHSFKVNVIIMFLFWINVWLMVYSRLSPCVLNP